LIPVNERKQTNRSCGDACARSRALSRHETGGFRTTAPVLILIKTAPPAPPTLNLPITRRKIIVKRRISKRPPEYDAPHITERPDGFYWHSGANGREYGPFASLAEAELDVLRNDDESLQLQDTLQELEAEIGIADWIDPDTGEPAEGCTPHIEDQ
jgi:hypothetical protein